MILPLTFQDVSFEIGGIRLIKDLNCTLEAGPRTMILGVNGAGAGAPRINMPADRAIRISSE